jgi:hypothetical protein
MSALDAVAAFVKVLGSALVGDSAETVFNVQAIGGFGGAEGEGDDRDGAGEQASGQVGYSSLGILGRPLPPEGALFAEAVALRVDGGLHPFGWRDMRLHAAVNPGGSGGTPAAGQVVFAGYGGAMLSHALTDDPVGSARANLATWYVPFDFDGDGVPQKAHTISIDPTPGNSSISIAHASGVFLTLTEDAGGGPGITWAVDASTFGRMKAGEVLIQATRIMLKGNVYIGAAAEAGVPLLGGPISPPCPSLFVSPA